MTDHSGSFSDMAPKTPTLTLEEIPGDDYQSLAEAQASALAGTASDLVSTIRALLSSGALVNQNGKIIPADTRGKNHA
ncbi:MAG: hypothetical protein IT296_02800 [Anaerolineae bacterium]|nr:hypothetical protein [Anaerolineales bacterium]MCC7511559.1 hypothetical protein [Anaerolineae bacterium]MCZ2288499.1 hypothetical protein [Anaerolineales bacterium]